jgi:hypothetical protein
MEVGKALILLESALDDIPRLKGLVCNNQEFPAWDRKVKEILRNAFGTRSKEYMRYDGIHSLMRVNSGEEKQQAYVDFLNKRETALKSIIQTTKDNKSGCQKIWDGCKNFLATIIAEKTK